MSPTSGAQPAVFLSYASQDAEAARRICEALRAAGVEVWFDQSELRGGDSWDVKIRKQIKDCALFVPLISANTQARQEGYFRLEWRLADQRTHLMSHDRAFLLPVTIDATNEQNARVPESFLAVQWTPVRDEASTAAFAGRARAVLQQEPAATDFAAILTRSTASLAPSKSIGEQPQSRLGLRLAVAIAVMGVVVAIWRPWRPSVDTRTTTAAPAAVSEARKLAQQARALLDDDPMRVRENFLAAERLCRRAISLDPGESEAWAASTRANIALYQHYQDRTTDRHEAARSAAETALRLAPDSVEAGFAYAVFESLTDANAAAVTRLEGLLKRAPGDRRILELLTRIHYRADRLDQAEAWAKQAEALTGGSSVALLERANYHWVRSELPQMQDCIDRALALKSSAEGLHLKLVLLTWGWGDLETATALRDKFPSSLLQEDNIVLMAYHAELWSRRFDGAVAVLERFRRDFLEEYAVFYPRGYLIGEALHLGGKTRAAEIQWRNALAAVETRMKTEPNSARLLVWKAKLLVRLGDQSEAERLFAAAAELGDFDGRTRYTHVLSVEKNVLLGRHDSAVVAAEQRAAPPTRRWILALNDLRFDPLFDGLRSDPRFRALIAQGEKSLGEMKAKMPAEKERTEKASLSNPAHPKSIAVLAFRQHSADPENEYLCEAIPDELCNKLGSVPGLTVSASASAFSFKGTKRERPAEMARQLGVAYLVDGSVQKIGNRLRVRAELIKAAGESVVWKSDLPEYEVKDMFAVQDVVVAAIAKNLQLHFDGAQNGATVHPDAYRLYHEGRRSWTRRAAWSNDDAERTRGLYRQAVALDPTFGRAHAGLVDVGVFTAVRNATNFSERASRELTELRVLADKAVQLEPTSAEAYTARARVLWLTWHTTESERDYRKAITLNSSYADAHVNLGRLLHGEGHMEEALLAMERAAELDPLTSRFFDNRSLVLNDAGHYREALVQADMAIALLPGSAEALRMRMFALSGMGRHAEAVEVARRPDIRESVHAAVVFARAGFTDEALHVRDRLQRGRHSKAFATAAAGRFSEAIELLTPEDAMIQSAGYVLFQSDLDPIRGDARFVRFLEQVGWKEAHDRAQRWRAAHPPEKSDVKK